MCHGPSPPNSTGPEQIPKPRQQVFPQASMCSIDVFIDDDRKVLTSIRKTIPRNSASFRASSFRSGSNLDEPLARLGKLRTVLTTETRKDYDKGRKVVSTRTMCDTMTDAWAR